jgi:hypothetical protein
MILRFCARGPPKRQLPGRATTVPSALVPRLRRLGDTARFVEGSGLLRHSFDIDMLDLAEQL